MVSVVKEPRANGSRLSPPLAQSLLWKGLTSSWSVHRSESCKPWFRQDRPNLLVLVSWLSQGQKQIPIREIFHCTGWQQHKPYFGSSLQHTLKGRCQIDLMVQLDSLLGDIDSRKPPAYLSPRISTFTPCFLSMTNCRTQCMASLSVNKHSFRDVQILFGKWRLARNITCMILA